MPKTVFVMQRLHCIGLILEEDKQRGLLSTVREGSKIPVLGRFST